MSNKPRVIAFYLPQFHPIPENDKWWGKGFTEWTNVGKAKSLFPGHYQPRVPADLGYYDLRVPEVREEQARLARDAGIEGFCYWHYYFGHGKRLLEQPIMEVVRTGKPDFPFCLGWANEPWKKKLWNKDSVGDELLIEQEYGGQQDFIQHFYTILPILKDKRYIKVDGKLLFLIYKPLNFDDCSQFISCWRNLAREEGIEGIHFVAHATSGEKGFEKYFNMGFDAVYTNRVANAALGYQRNPFLTLKNIFLKVFRFPRIVNYNSVIQHSYNEKDKEEFLYPGIICGWDHTPRSGRKGYLFSNFSVAKFHEHAKRQISLVEKKQQDHQIVFLKSWNEWGEGNFMEPDLRWGHGLLDALLAATDNRQQTT